MVAEFVARQQNGSPINGETPHQNHKKSNMPINGHGHNQNMMSNGSNNAVNGCISNVPNGSNGASNNTHPGTGNNGNSGRNAHHRSNSTHHLNNVSTSSSPTGFLHENQNTNSSYANGPAMSPNSQDEFSSSYDLAAQLKRKELFTQRKQREFIPDNKKDDSYWDRRRRNNEAAKRSREKRRYNDMVLEQRVVELTKENHVLKAQLDAIKDKYNICGENLVSVEQIMATLPTTEQVLSITKRAKFSNDSSPDLTEMDVEMKSNHGWPSNVKVNRAIYPQSPSPRIQTSVIQEPSSASMDSSSPPAQPTGASAPVVKCNLTMKKKSMAGFSSIINNVNDASAEADQLPSVVAAAPQMPSNAVVAAAAFAQHLNGGYLDPASQRSYPKYRENGSILPEMDRIEGRHELYTTPRSAFHSTDLHSASSNSNSFSATSSLNGNAPLNGARYNQHISPIARATNPQSEHLHLNHLQKLHSSHHHHHQTMQHFEVADNSPVHKISSQSNGTAGSDTDINAIDDDANVLNLSRRRSSDNTICNNNNSNNNNNNLNNNKTKNGSTTPPRITYQASISTAPNDDDHIGVDQPISDTNNSLPLKLRHKSHLGDKDAATALLALQHIKQEPNLRLSPPWDGEGSSDERDSGISIGAAEWGIQRKIIIPSSVGIGGIGAAIGNLAIWTQHHSEANANNDDGNVKEENVHLKTQIARLESEVASIKNMMILNTTSASATAVQ